MSLEGRLDRLQQEIGDVKKRGRSTHDGVVALQTRMEGVATDVAKISRLLIEGNGRPPITVEMARLDVAVAEARQDIDRQQAEIDGRCDRCAVARVESRKIHWAAIAAIGGSIAGVGGLVTAVVMFF